MNLPTVACVMLANGRPEMCRRAMRSWAAQTYEGQKRILVYNNTGGPIGTLRNTANGQAEADADIILHWDSDDWSHPNRIAEQVALLQSSGAECVGYNEMLFWADQLNLPQTAEAWLYNAAGCKYLKNYVLGTSMCYWRETWQRNPFPDYSPGCDDLYWSTGDKKQNRSAVKIEAATSFLPIPRMIASVHGDNTVTKIDSTSAGGMEVWQRAPDWDAYCREAMKL